jgi:SAM-dependent methyltransferase
MKYSRRFFRRITPDSDRSARIVVPLLATLFQPRSVLDVGCGVGGWTREFLAADLDAVGVDRDAPGPLMEIPPDRYLHADLSRPLSLARQFDLALCLETAEHLPPERGPGFVRDLCALADVVCFSAAIPGQGGRGHINERPQSYWVELFQSLGFAKLDCLRPNLWHLPDVAPWYAQNLFAFVRSSRLPDFPTAVASAANWPPDIVHPRNWARAAVPSEMTLMAGVRLAKALRYMPARLCACLRP